MVQRETDHQIRKKPIATTPMTPVASQPPTASLPETANLPITLRLVDISIITTINGAANIPLTTAAQ